MKIKVKIIKHKQAHYMYKEKTVEWEGKTYNVYLIQAGIPGTLTTNIAVFTHGKNMYLIPEYYELATTYYIAYRIAGLKTFEQDLIKIKVTNPKKLLKHATIIDETNGVILAKIENITFIIKGKSIYTDKYNASTLEEIITKLKKT